MIGFALSTVSPSSSSTTRSTPCVDGCCGPMLSVMVSVRTELHLLRPELLEVGVRHRAARRVVREGDLLIPERRVLAQRPALPVLGEQDAREVRMAGEADAVEVVGLALVPVGGGPHAADGRHARVLVADLHLEDEAGVLRHRTSV